MPRQIATLLRLVALGALVVIGASACGQPGAPEAVKDDVIVYSADRSGAARLYVMPAAGGRSRPLRTPGLWADSPALSPDGRQVAFTGSVRQRRELTGAQDDYISDLYVIDIDGTDLRRLDAGPGENFEPAWSPDGKSLLFSSSRAPDHDLYVIAVGGGSQHPLAADGRPRIEPAWSPDGRHIVCTSSDAGGDRQLLVLGADGTPATQLTHGRGDREYPAWSPDGRWIAFSATFETLYSDLYLIPAEGGRVRRLTDNGDTYDTYPRWSPDGSQLLFWTIHWTWTAEWKLALLDVDAALRSEHGVGRDSGAIHVLTGDLGPTGDRADDEPLGADIGEATQ